MNHFFSGRAYVDHIIRYGWDMITVLYENNDSMMRLKGIFDRTAEVRMVRDSKPFYHLRKNLKQASGN